MSLVLQRHKIKKSMSKGLHGIFTDTQRNGGSSASWQQNVRSRQWRGGGQRWRHSWKEGRCVFHVKVCKEIRWWSLLQRKCVPTIDHVWWMTSWTLLMLYFQPPQYCSLLVYAHLHPLGESNGQHCSSQTFPCQGPLALLHLAGIRLFTTQSTRHLISNWSCHGFRDSVCTVEWVEIWASVMYWFARS